MIERKKLYINGQWVNPVAERSIAVINPATEDFSAQVVLGGAADVDLAVAAARKAFNSWSKTSSAERATYIHAIHEKMVERRQELMDVISRSMGCPPHIAQSIQVDGPTLAMSLFSVRAALMDSRKRVANSLVVCEAVGVCGFINPWNYPLHQFVAKVGAALAAGCTMVVKPSEQTPLQDFIMADIFHEVGLPPGVFNLVTGLGEDVGHAIAAHEQIDMVSFTGSVAGGVAVAKAAAPTVKRVTQELGGKSPFIITSDADLDAAVRYGVDNVMINSGQTCTALTRMLVPAELQAHAVAIAKKHTEGLVVGMGENAFLGPLSSSIHRERVRASISAGIAEGATLVTGGVAAPGHQTRGFYLEPTIFSNVKNSMHIAREEIFGPVLCILPYDTIDEAIAMANDNDYGLSSAVWAGSEDEAMGVARQLQAGLCYLQGATFNYHAPFGGCKKSGNGREYGDEGVHEFVELKAIQL